MKRLWFVFASLFVLMTAFCAQAKTIRVPGDQPTIQAGIEAAVNGDTVLVADGVYKGPGNKDLDFKGKAITVKSENGPASTVIDCEGTGRGFYFHSGETSGSVVSGFTIRNGSPGGSQVRIALKPQTGQKAVSVDVQESLLRPSNDGDAAVEPGEVVGMDISLKNNSTKSINDVTATLKTTDERVTGLIPVYTGTRVTDWKTVNMAQTGITGSYGTMFGNATKSLFFQFVKINEDFKPLGDTILFILEMRSGNNLIGTDDFSTRVGADVILDRVDVDDDLRPGGEPEDMDLRFRNITASNFENLRVTLEPDSRRVRITTDRVEFSEFLAGRTRTLSFETKIDEDFLGHVSFRVKIEVNRKLVNVERFRCYFGMHTQYLTYWVEGDDNRNGVAEAGEKVGLQVVRWNPTSVDAYDVETVLGTTDAAIVSIGRSTGEYRDIPADEAKEARREYEFTIAGADAFASNTNFAKRGHTVEFSLSTQEDKKLVGKETFTMRIGGMIRYLSPQGYDELMAAISDSKDLGASNNGDGVPDPSEIVEIDVTLINISDENIDDVEAELDSDDDVRFIVDYQKYGEIRRRGRTKSSKFLVKIDDTFQGSKVKFDLDITGKVAGRRENLGKDVFTIPVRPRESSVKPFQTPTWILSGTTPPIIPVAIVADGYGGGISCTKASSPTIERNIIIRNSATNDGGGIFCGDGSWPFIVNNVIAGNLAGGYGGGISCVNNSSPAMISNTVFGNSASTNGGAIGCQNSSFPTALNMILWGDSPNEIYTGTGSVIDITYSDIQGGWPGVGNINANPRFMNVAVDDHHLMDNSPCIGAGNMTGSVPSKDIGGNVRPNPIGSNPDMGAYESAMPALPLTIAGVTPSGLDQGATGEDITITGVNFLEGATVSFSGAGITVNTTTFVDSTKLVVNISISSTAPAGLRNLIVTNPGNQTVIGEDIFEVNAVAGIIVSVETKQAVVTGSPFTLAVSVESVPDLAGFQMDVSFNSAILVVVKVEEGTLLSSAGGTYWLEPTIDNAKGKITGIMAARTGSPSATGTGTLAIITFTAKGMGEGYVRPQNVTLSNSRGQSVQVKLLDGGVTVIGSPPWDVNKDGKVDVLDFVVIAQYLGQTVTTPMDPNPDVNGDGVVNLFDFVMVGMHFGEVYSAAAPSRDMWKVDPRYLPVLTRMYNMMEDSASSDPGFVRTKELLHSLISSVRASRTELLQNYPNPFNPETWIPFQLSEGSNVEVRIYNSAGQLVKAMDLGYRNAGYYTSKADAAQWDGTDESGEKVASGIYFYTVRAGAYTATRKMLLMK